MRFRLTGLVALAVLTAALGCAGRRTSSYAPPSLSRASGLVPATPAPDEPFVRETDLLHSLADKLRTAGYADPATHKKGNYLALSGGGMFGAFTVGTLCGWSQAGTRPTFDVVTGVSTGALIATYAFLGPAYDRRMTDIFLSLSERSVYRKRGAAAILWRDSAASSAPLGRLIEDEVDGPVLAEVAAAHRAGRRLYVGSTNLGTRRLVVWDMGAIAASGRPDALDLYRKVLLASASVPGFLPPVEFDTTINGERFQELHVDGGATTGLFLRVPDVTGTAAGKTAPLAGSNAYAIVAGKLYADPGQPERRAMKIGADSVRTLLYSQTRGELNRIYTLCVVGGMGFNLAAVPEGFAVGSDAMTFDRATLRRLYDEGFGQAAAGRSWRHTPPGAEPQEQAGPRSGNEFYAPGAGR